MTDSVISRGLLALFMDIEEVIVQAAAGGITMLALRLRVLIAQQRRIRSRLLDSSMVFCVVLRHQLKSAQHRWSGTAEDMLTAPMSPHPATHPSSACIDCQDDVGGPEAGRCLGFRVRLRHWDSALREGQGVVWGLVLPLPSIPCKCTLHFVKQSRCLADTPSDAACIVVTPLHFAEFRAAR